jgi:hypothetical protein
MLGHQGGWDELLLPALIVALVLLVPAWRRRRRAKGSSAPDADPRAFARDDVCPYCGADVTAGVDRCAACGFRLPR